ncbi:uncharacterized protein CLUP02_10904 [Colletotrichum lupini]|uniref:Uncharacterized protein n=1 Tax=Colletotrichum lupini TaxID=145971 RepID=A0A9Q8SXL0_9PEZI|nr:uncharacterized protein CLUP02_10904 [Colletotrichum lupini]UQC85407.1 hypothetical protein CLUP02_10904 [Colletotrichum lupini]
MSDELSRIHTGNGVVNIFEMCLNNNLLRKTTRVAIETDGEMFCENCPIVNPPVGLSAFSRDLAGQMSRPSEVAMSRPDPPGEKMFSGFSIQCSGVSLRLHAADVIPSAQGLIGSGSGLWVSAPRSSVVSLVKCMPFSSLFNLDLLFAMIPSLIFSALRNLPSCLRYSVKSQSKRPGHGGKKAKSRKNKIW